MTNKKPKKIIVKGKPKYIKIGDDYDFFDLFVKIEQNFNNRQERKNDMTDTMTQFSNHFLKNKNLYYCSHRELFFNYENDHYTIYNEDDIIHDILRLIHRDSKLFSWKFK